MKKILIVLFLVPQISFGFLVAQLNLEQLTRLAERIFVGKCLEVQIGKDRNGRPVQYVTFEVEATLKGNPEPSVTFKQIRFNSEVTKGKLTGTTTLSELPDYQRGEEVVLFLSEPSELGLTAPVGFTQGKFLVLQRRNGKTVTNGIANQRLFRGMKKSGSVKALVNRPGAELPYDDFLSLVKKLVP